MTFKEYRRYTLADLIEALRSIGDAPVFGLTGEIDSYRGYYERNATEPANDVQAGNWLAEKYSNEVGKAMQGWKGGDYLASVDELIYYAPVGDIGPCIIGLEADGDGLYRPVLLAYDNHFE